MIYYILYVVVAFLIAATWATLAKIKNPQRIYRINEIIIIVAACLWPGLLVICVLMFSFACFRIFTNWLASKIKKKTS